MKILAEAFFFLTLAAMLAWGLTLLSGGDPMQRLVPDFFRQHVADTSPKQPAAMQEPGLRFAP